MVSDPERRSVYGASMLVVGPAALKATTIQRAVRDPEPGTLDIDLSATSFIEPSGLVVLAFLVDMAGTREWPVSFTPPRMWDPKVYLSRMGLADLLDDAGCSTSLPVVQHHAPDSRFVELQRFDASQPAEDIVDLIETRLSDWGDGYLQTTLYDTMFELGLNVEEHADEPGFVAAQCYQNRRVCVAVGDFGIGIEASLADAGHEFDTPAEAIIKAATTRLSAKDINGGAGLPMVVRTFTERHPGRLTVVSGGVAVMFRPRGDPRISELDHATPGTFLFGTLPWR
jgi:hypothetical protein